MAKEEVTTGTSGPLKARPIFISSTFKDMHAERDYLRQHVFPRLEEELRKNRHQLDPIDLRLGIESTKVESEEARELLVLKVCLAEIKRSRPFLLSAGDRYGWVPPEERIAAAAREQGFETSTKDKSVTALEIEYGILKEDHDQRRRSFFFFRKELPYSEMPEKLQAEYSDAYSPDPQVRERHKKLGAMKERIRKDAELGTHVCDYTAGWDGARGWVTGLEEFGEKVFQKLWQGLKEETAAYAAHPTAGWQEEERASLAEFVEHRSRHFTGRKELLEQLKGLAHSPAIEGACWGACIMGAPGSGKSAVFAQLYRGLRDDKSILLLANAAGGTIRGASVDSMLNRWIQELADFLQVTNPLPEKASNDDVDAAFMSLLHRASARQRVVVMLDALDQFEATPRGQYLTWLKGSQWPANARLVATSLPCTASEVLCKFTGIQTIKLAPLEPADAEQIARGIQGRYHQPFDREVLGVLTQKRLSDGTPAFGNPLWLTLAVEQLCLLDGDDFVRMDKEFTGTPQQRLHELMLDIASRMPADIEGLYGWLLEYTEKVFGRASARGFAAAIALSRHGWRDSDLIKLIPPLAKILLPQESVPQMDELRLATLRRGFRAHITRRGQMEQMDFFHGQMRAAIRSHSLRDAGMVKKLHYATADHLEGLAPDDPLGESELMVHLIAADEPARAATVYANLGAIFGGRTGATEALAQYVIQGETQKPNLNLAWVTSLLSQPGLTDQQKANIVYGFDWDLYDRIENTAILSTRHGIAEAARCTMMQVAGSDPSNARWQRGLSVSLENVGHVLMAQGDLAGALKAYEDSLVIRQQLATSADADDLSLQNRAISHVNVGDALITQGNLAGALKAYQDSLGICQQLAKCDPSNAEWQRNLSVSYDSVGDVLYGQGDLALAFESYRDSLTIRQQLAESDPSNTRCQRDLFVSHLKMGDVLRDQGNLAEALKACRDSFVTIQQVAQSDPSNAGWQRDLSVSHEKVGDVLRAQGDLAGALKAYRDSLDIRQQLAKSDPSNAGWQRDLSISHDRVGNVLFGQGDLAGALKAYRDSLVIAQQLAKQDPSNAGWQQDAWVSYTKMARVSEKAGSSEAMDWWRKAYEKLSDMKQKGLFISPQDEKVLEQLRAKVGADGGEK